MNGANWGWAFCERERLAEERVRRKRVREGLRQVSVGMEERINHRDGGLRKKEGFREK